MQHSVYEVLKKNVIFYLKGPCMPTIYKNNLVKMFTDASNSSMGLSDPILNASAPKILPNLSDSRGYINFEGIK